MFERFSERSCEVVQLAQEEAREMRHGYIGTEHVLLGLLRTDGLAARALEALGVEAEGVRTQVIRLVGSGKDEAEIPIPFTPRAKKVLELALREALSLGHNYIGTEHILLGLVRENEGVAARILLDFDADSEKIRNEVIRMLSGPGARGSARYQEAPEAPDEQKREDIWTAVMEMARELHAFIERHEDKLARYKPSQAKAKVEDAPSFADVLESVGKAAQAGARFLRSRG